MKLENSSELSVCLRGSPLKSISIGMLLGMRRNEFQEELEDIWESYLHEQRLKANAKAFD